MRRDGLKITILSSALVFALAACATYAWTSNWNNTDNTDDTDTTDTTNTEDQDTATSTDEVAKLLRKLTLRQTQGK